MNFRSSDFLSFPSLDIDRERALNSLQPTVTVRHTASSPPPLLSPFSSSEFHIHLRKTNQVYLWPKNSYISGDSIPKYSWRPPAWPCRTTVCNSTSITDPWSKCSISKIETGKAFCDYFLGFFTGESERITILKKKLENSSNHCSFHAINPLSRLDATRGRVAGKKPNG